MSLDQCNAERAVIAALTYSWGDVVGYKYKEWGWSYRAQYVQPVHLLVSGATPRGHVPFAGAMARVVGDRYGCATSLVPGMGRGDDRANMPLQAFIDTADKLGLPAVHTDL